MKKINDINTLCLYSHYVIPFQRLWFALSNFGPLTGISSLTIKISSKNFKRTQNLRSINNFLKRNLETHFLTLKLKILHKNSPKFSRGKMTPYCFVFILFPTKNLKLQNTNIYISKTTFHLTCPVILFSKRSALTQNNGRKPRERLQQHFFCEAMNFYTKQARNDFVALCSTL